MANSQKRARPRNMLHAEFGRRSKDVWTSVGSPQTILGTPGPSPLRWGVSGP